MEGFSSLHQAWIGIVGRLFSDVKLGGMLSDRNSVAFKLSNGTPDGRRGSIRP
jgi:hypothetical protein